MALRKFSSDHVCVPNPASPPCVRSRTKKSCPFPMWSTNNDTQAGEVAASSIVTEGVASAGSASTGNPGKRRATFGIDGFQAPRAQIAFSAAPSQGDVWRVPPLPPPPPPLARSPVSGADPSVGFPFLLEGGQHGLGAAMQEAVERSLPATPRSPSPTCSPPSSPKRAKNSSAQDEGVLGGESAAEEDLYAPAILTTQPYALCHSLPRMALSFATIHFWLLSMLFASRVCASIPSDWIPQRSPSHTPPQGDARSRARST